jgi:hypothetical protein
VGIRLLGCSIDGHAQAITWPETPAGAVLGGFYLHRQLQGKGACWLAGAAVTTRSSKDGMKTALRRVETFDARSF